MKSDETTKLIMNSSLDAIVCMDTTCAVTLWTLQAEKLFGWKEEEVKGKSLPDLIFPLRYREGLVSEVKDFMGTGDAKAFNKVRELQAINKEGKEIPVEMTLAPVKQNGEEFFCAFIRDITERKKTEAELRKNELQYRSLIEQASDPIMLTDFNGNFIDVNVSLCRMFGYSKEELLGMNIRSLIDPEQLKVRPMDFSRLAKGEHLFNERRMMHKDGTIIEVEANVKKINDDMVLAIARDITERKRSEAILKESEFSFRKVSENELLGVAWASPEGYVLNANPAFCKMLGYKLEELKGLHFGEFTHPEDTAKELQLAEEIFQGKRDNYRLEKRYKTKAGEYIWVELNLSCFRNFADKSIELFIGIIQNIHERKKAETAILLSEKKYRLLFFENPLPMMMMSIPDMQFIDVNQAAIEQYGYTKDEFLSMTAVDIRPKEDVGSFLKIVNENDGSINRMGTFRHRKKDGSIIHVEIITHRIIHEGKPAWLVLANNVTEKFIAEERLKQSHKELRQLTTHLQTIREDERTRIAREIHDELGQQLTGMKMDVAWIGRKIPRENKIVHDKIASIIELVDQTVKSVRQISSDLRPVILDDLGIIDALDWQSHEFEKRTGVRCRFRSSFNEMAIGKSLSTGIFRVYQETLTNVARHAGASEINTTLELDNNDIILKVYDNGQGFDEKEVKYKKTLGLLGMKERARMFGGKITIESIKGKGTAVTLQVPLNLISGETN